MTRRAARRRPRGRAPRSRAAPNVPRIRGPPSPPPAGRAPATSYALGSAPTGSTPGTAHTPCTGRLLARVADPGPNAPPRRPGTGTAGPRESKSPPEFPLGEAWIDPARAGELATLQTNIGTFVQQSAVQFITGRKSLDSDRDSYLENLDQLGLKRFLQIYQQAHDKTH